METLEAQQTGVKNTEVATEFLCGPKTYSFMASLVVPLPPVIPVFISSQPRIFVTHPKDVSIEEISLLKQDGAPYQLAIVDEHPEVQGDRVVTFYKVQEDCDALSGAQLEIDFFNRTTGRKKHETIKVKYVPGNIEFNWWYLSA